MKVFLKSIPFISTLHRRFRQSKNDVIYLIVGRNNKLFNGKGFRNVRVDIQGDNNEIFIGENTIVKNTTIFIRGNSHKLIIENNCYFGEGELWMEDNDGSLIIKEKTTIERAHLAVTEPYSKIVIGKDCMLARFVEIRTGDSHSIVDEVTGKRINAAGDVTLGDHVWIGAHAKILKGVTIGNNSVIGTSSVVTRDVPSHSVVAGIPAKVVQSNINWKRERL